MISAKDARSRTESYYHEKWGIDLDRKIKDTAESGHSTCRFYIHPSEMDFIMYKGFCAWLTDKGYHVAGTYDTHEIVIDIRW